MPTIFSWASKIDPTVTDQTGHSTDILPTLAALAGVAGDELDTDGVDLTPLLLRGESLPNRMLFWRAGAQRAVRAGPWKLYQNGTQTELYHLDNDLGERRNLAEEKPELVERLSAAWAAWEVDVNTSAEQYER